MAKNGEELYEQEQFEKENPIRITYSPDELDKLFEQRNQIEKECKKLQLDKQSEKEFSHRVLQIMGWRL